MNIKLKLLNNYKAKYLCIIILITNFNINLQKKCYNDEKTNKIIFQKFVFYI